MADAKVLSNTPLGDQLNLYRRGLDEHSGAGKPPHQEMKDSIFPPACLTLSKHSKASKWSIPGSKPISLSIVTSAATALMQLTC